MIQRKANARRVWDTRADDLAYVFAQLKLLNIGTPASGCEYVPSRRKLTTQERRAARKVLREQLQGSVELLTRVPR